jgi:CheY-like chemotaxis protein
MHILLKSISQIFEPIAQEKRIQLDVKGSPDIPETLYGDDTRITQVLEQLLTNALKFTEKGTISLHAEVLPREIHNVVVLQIKIKDTGIGIAPNKLTRIFEILYNTQDYKSSEKFLGLPLVKNLLEKLGGNIKVQSHLGQGSTFICEVPLKIIETQNKYIETPPNIVLDSLAGLRVLYVEDNMLNQRWIGKFLQNWHVSIDFASNGRQAVEKARNCAPEHFYHVVLMDLQMPEMDGYEATKIIRTFTQIPIIALTASPPRSAQKQALDVGMNDFISKPFPPELLHEKLREHTAYEYFVFLEKVQRKQLADFEAVVEFADGDLAYQQEMFSLYKKFFADFVLLYEEAMDKQDLAKLKILAHKSRPSTRLLCLDSLEIELQNAISILELGGVLPNTHLTIIQKIKKYCTLCLAHLNAYSPES